MKFLDDILKSLGAYHPTTSDIKVEFLVIIMIFTFVLLGASFYLLIKIYENIFYRLERETLDEALGKIRNKTMQHKKSFLSFNRTKETFIVHATSIKTGDVFVDDLHIYETFEKNQKVRIIFQKEFLVNRFSKDTKYLGLHIVDILPRKY